MRKIIILISFILISFIFVGCVSNKEDKIVTPQIKVDKPNYFTNNKNIFIKLNDKQYNTPLRINDFSSRTYVFSNTNGEINLEDEIPENGMIINYIDDKIENKKVANLVKVERGENSNKIIDGTITQITFMKNFDYDVELPEDIEFYKDEKPTTKFEVLEVYGQPTSNTENDIIYEISGNQKIKLNFTGLDNSSVLQEITLYLKP